MPRATLPDISNAEASPVEGGPGLCPLRLAVGSRRAPKLEGVRAAVRQLFPTLKFEGQGFDSFVLWQADVLSGVAETPLDLGALVEGAERRARTALRGAAESGFEPHFGLGLEGGAFRGAAGGLFLQSWACVTDGRRESLGAGPALPLPEAIAARLLLGESLAAVIDDTVGRDDIRSREGTFGILTRNRLHRASIFETALLCAFAPFDCPEFYPEA